MGLVTLYSENGETLGVHPVDARELVRAGVWSLTPPSSNDPTPEPIAEVIAVLDEAKVTRKKKGKP